MGLSDHVRRLEQEEAKRIQSATAKERKVAEGAEILKTSLRTISTDIEHFLIQNGFKKPMEWRISGTTYEHEKFSIPVSIRYTNEDGLKIHVSCAGPHAKGFISVEKGSDGGLIFKASCHPPGTGHTQVQKALDAFFM